MVMKKNCFIAILFFCILLLSSCNNTLPGANIVPGQKSVETDIPDDSLYSPVDSTVFSGMPIEEVELLLKEAGFSEFQLTTVDDLTSSSDIADGTVESVLINDTEKYTTQTEFEKNSQVVIIYHNIPKITVPFSSSDASTEQYMDVGKAFFDAGFRSIETDEIYDLPAGSESKTVLTAEGRPVEKDTSIPFDSKIQVIEHFPTSEYVTDITLNCRSNLLFNKYDVAIILDETDLGTLPHGGSATHHLTLPAGHHKLIFTKVDDSSITGAAEFEVTSDTEATYRVWCDFNEIDITQTDFTLALTDELVLMPFSSSHYLRKDYHEVVKELVKLGFAQVNAEKTTDPFWGVDAVNSCVRISIGNIEEYQHDELILKSKPVTVYYHIADFTFELSSLTITEKETFDIPYFLNSSDPIESIDFRIDNPDILQHNDDGTFTALIPGKATVSAFCGDDLCSECVIEVTEIIVPIEKLVFTSEGIELAVGSTFTVDYSIFPENANYRSMSVELSNDLLEYRTKGQQFIFYSNEEGETEVSFYQDDRHLGTCLIRSTFIDIEDLVLDEVPLETTLGHTISIPFKLFPETATNKGIQISSSDTAIAEVTFDERGASIIKVTGKGIGEATLTITVPNGTEYTHVVAVKEVDPTRLTITGPKANRRIEVGDEISLKVVWFPGNTTVKELTWESSDSSVFKVVEDGLVRAVGIGTAEITATHKSGLSESISLTADPTLVTGIDISTDRAMPNDFYPGDSFTLQASVAPITATDPTLLFKSSDESVLKVSDKGVVTAVGPGTAHIIITSPDGPMKSVQFTVNRSPQKFRINYSTYLHSNDHLGGDWSYGLTVNGEKAYNGYTVVLDPDSSFSVSFWVEEYDDSYPDSGGYYQKFDYTDDLCKYGFSYSGDVEVIEVGGRYSGNVAIWKLSLTVTPIS